MYLKFESIPRPVLLAQGLKLLPHLARVFANWPFREVPGERFRDPTINVLQDGGEGVIQAPWIASAQRYADAADLAHGLAQHLARCWIESDARVLGIAAAATRFGDDLAVFVGGPQSGKSLLISCLSVAGHSAFADSILPISVRSRDAISFGMAPRLKLPLPSTFQGPLRRRLTRCLNRCTPHRAYLRPELANIAAFEDRAPIGAFVLLDRADGGATNMRSAPPGTLLKRLLLGSFDALRSSRTALALLHEMVTDIPCYRLTWSDPSEAVGTLQARFAIRRPRESEVGLRVDPLGPPPRRRISGPRTPAGRRFRHTRGIEERMADGELFLVDPAGEAIYHLNGLGAGVWRLLDGSHGLCDVVSVLRAAFPTVDGTLIEGDVMRLVADLTERGLLVELSAGTDAAEPATATP